jgi:hypothetical protein
MNVNLTGWKPDQSHPWLAQTRHGGLNEKVLFCRVDRIDRIDRIANRRSGEG